MPDLFKKIKSGTKLILSANVPDELLFSFYQLGIVPGDCLIVRQVSVGSSSLLVEVEGKLHILIDQELFRSLEFVP